MTQDYEEKWAHEAKAALKAAGFLHVSVEPSNVTGSPYRYVYVYADPETGVEGLHALISQAAELEATTVIWYGVYDDLEDFQDSGCDEVPTLAEAIARVWRLWDAKTERRSAKA